MGGENLLVFVDCEELRNSSQEEIFAYFCSQMIDALMVRGIEPDPVLGTAGSTPTRMAFEGVVRKLNHRGLRSVFILDEFEQLSTNSQLNVSFFSVLRSAAGRYQLVFLTASTQLLVELTYSGRSQEMLSSPFFNIFAPLFLGLLAGDEAHALIRTPMEAAGIKVPVELEDYIYELVGGHPFALQVACFYACEIPYDYAEVERRTQQELEAHFEYCWHNLSPSEREVLCHLAGAALREPSDPAIRVVLRDLGRKCLISQARGSYGYPSRAWAEFVGAQNLTGRVHEGSQERNFN